MDFQKKRFVFAFRYADLDGEITFLDNGKIIVHKDDKTGTITATRNRCKHQGGSFQKANGCVLTCSRHGWKLDVSTMRYVNPLGGLTQEQLHIEHTPGGAVQLFEVVDTHWEFDRQTKEPLSPAEFTICFYAHACVEVRCGSKGLFTDPWLVGPAFTRGWWLVHQPPADWLERLASADAIYISHNHSDHLNVHTLTLLAARNPNVPMFVPAFDSDSCALLLRKIGLRNITTAPFGVWIALGNHGRFMLLQDSTGRHDSGILIEYKGHRVLNTVDSQNLCNGILPAVDVLLTSFAGGASGYPLCWEQYSEQYIATFVQNRRRAALLHVLSMVGKVQPKVYIPFAGYFTEAHPADSEIRRLNVKNTPQEVCEFIIKHYPDIFTWIPEPGGILDIGLCQSYPPLTQPAEAVYDFNKYLQEIQESLTFPALQTIEGIKEYFRWAGFQSDLVLHVIETNEDFQSVMREFYVDFFDLSFPNSRPLRGHRYLRMRCRSDVFRHVLRKGLPWEEISIGFQARLFREPDVYNFDFWDHFQNKLPKEPPQWENSISRESAKNSGTPED